MKAELHCHVKLFAHRPFRPAQLQRRLNRARDMGLDVLAVTEHMDVPDFRGILQCLEELCGRGTGALEWRGLTVLAGAEVSIKEGGDVLCIGTPETVRELEKRLAPVNADNLPSFKGLLDASGDLGFLRIGAHPCRRGKELWKLGPMLKKLDALEINATELPMAGRVQERAKNLGMPVVAGSDAHHWLQIGRVYNLLPPVEKLTAVTFKQALLRGEIVWCRGKIWPVLLKGLRVSS